MIKIRTSRTYVMPYKSVDGEEDFSVTFKFAPSEDLDITSFKAKLADSQLAEIPVNASDDEKQVAFQAATKAANEEQRSLMDFSIRKAIVACEGFVDEETNEPVVVQNIDGSFNEQVQKVIFDVIQTYNDYYIDVMTAYLGPKGKNFKSGLMALLNGAGVQETAKDVSTTAVNLGATS